MIEFLANLAQYMRWSGMIPPNRTNASGEIQLNTTSGLVDLHLY